MHDRMIRCKPNGAVEVTVVTEFQRPEEIRRWREHLQSELERARRVVSQMEAELKDLDATCTLLDKQGI